MTWHEARTSVVELSTRPKGPGNACRLSCLQRIYVRGRLQSILLGRRSAKLVAIALHDALTAPLHWKAT